MIECKSNKQICTRLYIIAWAIAQIFVILASSEIAYTFLGSNLIRYFSYGVAGLILVVKVLFFDKYTTGSWLLLFASTILISLVAYNALGLTLILHGAFLLSLKNVDIKKLIKVDVRIRMIVTSVLFILAITGVLNNYSDVINGNMKNAFGYQHPNSFAYQIITIIIELLYSRKEKIGARDIFIISGILIILWTVCASRTNIYSFIFFFIIFFLADKSFFNIHKMFKSLFLLAMPLCEIGSWIMAGLYSQGNRFAIKINSILTSRLAFSERFLDRYAISMFGNKIHTVSTRESIFLKTRTEILDMSYIRLLIEYGTIFFVVFLVLYLFIQLCLVKNHRYKEAAIVVYFSLLGIASTGFLSPFSNFSLLFITFLWEDYQKTGRGEEIGFNRVFIEVGRLLKSHFLLFQ